MFGRVMCKKKRILKASKEIWIHPVYQVFATGIGMVIWHKRTIRRQEDQTTPRGNNNQATPTSIKLLHFHEEARSSTSVFRSMKLCRGNHDSTVLRRLRPGDVEDAAAGGAVALFIGEEVVGVNGEVTGSE